MTNSDPRFSAESCDDLIERLRNPMWAHGNIPFESPQLEKEENLAAMNEAADQIEMLRRVIRLAAIELQYSFEDLAQLFSKAKGKPHD